MALPLNMDNWFQVNNSLAAGKVRIISQYNTAGGTLPGYDMNMCLTTPQFTNYAGASHGTLVPMISDSTALGTNDFIVIGNSGMHKNSNLGFITPMYFACSDFDDDDLYIAQLLALPYFGDLGNTPTSTTDRVALTKQIYEAGMWIWRKGNLPPVNMECRTNFELELDECYGDQTGSRIYNLAEVPNVASPNLIYFNIEKSYMRKLTAYGGTAGVPYIGTWDCFWNQPSQPNTQEFLTSGGQFFRTDMFTSSSIEWVAKNNNNNDTVTGLYLYQCATNSVKWAEGLGGVGSMTVINSKITVYPTSTPPVDNRLLHHGVVAIDTTAQTGSFYYGDSRDNWGHRGTYTGSLHANSARWDTSARIVWRFGATDYVKMQLGCFRAWNGIMTEEQAELCWLHNKWRIVG